ncbi:hypothetical protein L1049_011690 [Liquidambar formosana]|uniref:Carotenoid cleavage dioxygenase 4 n=1 Tax=Liquidambar formosana TaxID=63359 RepID=A0AAP0WY99_LIQFO
MDAFSSSFLPTFSPPKLHLSQSTTTTIITPSLTSPYSSSPYVPLLYNIFSVKMEEKPHIAAATTTVTETSTQSSKTQTPWPTPSPATAYVVKRRAEPSLPAVIFNAIEDIINTFIDPPLRRPSVDPRLVLSDNFAPVDELPPTECEVVKGSLPPCLDGVYIRNGPNPQFLRGGPYHHFDGDGMLHSIRISKGNATFCSRYVKTYKYTVELDAGSPVLPNIFSSFHGLSASATRGALSVARVLFGHFNPINGIGTANTSLALFGNRLYALCESDLPYAVRLTSDGDIETLGRDDFDGKLLVRMTAHPKIDADTGETFAFRYGLMPPFLTYFRFHPDGTIQPDVPIHSIVRPSFIHDFAVTKKYAIFADIGMNPMEMVVGGRLRVGSDSDQVPRLGIIPRYAKDESEIRWFEVPGLNILHAINAWDDEEDGNAIVMVAPNILSVEHILERMDLIQGSVEKVRIDLKTGIVSRHTLSARNLELGVINPAYAGKKNKYVYAAVGDPLPKISGVVKLDLSKGERCVECTVASRMYGPGCYGGEPFFVAREPNQGEEDDGYVVSYVHDEMAGESRFLVMDAKSPNFDIVAAVKLPQRVPHGFHGLFVKESDLNKL